jgi:putative peptidoglycan lipid II flippase
MLNPIAAYWVYLSLMDKIFELAKLISLGVTVFTISLLILGVRKSTFSASKAVLN